MKADGGALFYIIIAVLSLIVSAISKSNKKTAGKPVISNAPEEETEEVPQNPWEKELQEIFGKKEPAASVPEKRLVRENGEPNRDRVPEITGTQKAMYAQEAEEELKNYRGEISIEQPAVRSVSEDEIRSSKHAPEEEEPVFSSGFEEFDLRKAIIYNEVLNRKYI